MRHLLLAILVLQAACASSSGGEPGGAGGDARAGSGGAIGGAGSGGSGGTVQPGGSGGATGGAGSGGSGEPGGSGGAAGSGGAGGSGGGAPAPCDVAGVPGSCRADCGAYDRAAAGICAGGLLCCTPAIATDCDPDAMPQPNAGLAEEPGDPGCAAGMARVESFCIDRHEASFVTVGTGEPWSPFWNPGTTRVRAVSLRGAVPQGYVDGEQAAAACSASGKRACTATEWLRACAGPSGTAYPYGDTFVEARCNVRRATHPVVELFGTADPWIYGYVDHPCINQLPGSLERTGARAECVTTEGVHDMAGNLQEWIDDPAGTLRGGNYIDGELNGRGCLARVTAHDLRHRDYSTGVRCCADAQ